MDNGRVADIDLIKDPLPVNPIDFYDNDDGFWNEYIEKKKERLGRVKLHVLRPFLKH